MAEDLKEKPKKTFDDVEFNEEVPVSLPQLPLDPKEQQQIFKKIDECIDERDIKGLKKLLAQYKERPDILTAIINLPGKAGWTLFGSAVRFAARTGNLGTVRLLVENGGKLDYQEKDGRTPLHIAAAEGTPELINALAKSPTFSQALKTYDNVGVTPIQLAAASANTKAVKCLLDNKADINSQSIKQTQTKEYLSGLTVLMLALEGGLRIRGQNSNDIFGLTAAFECALLISGHPRLDPGLKNDIGMTASDYLKLLESKSIVSFWDKRKIKEIAAKIKSREAKLKAETTSSNPEAEDIADSFQKKK
jgi:ankyrin repeat protein